MGKPVDASAAGRALRAARGFVADKCPVCGRPFEGYAGRMYCSSACNSKAWRQRHPERAREQSRRNWERRRDMQRRPEQPAWADGR
jgi:uncharacterized Zn finger protein (UPF0148 family)